ncbi:MAG: bifunctional ornithine acetyltransferase/N-acetylglutamate synthase [Clostridiales bacterium]|jgi:glutamate N-acetyltransferase/amino-acid N-acetyltransferase|nr:bifunctional ornithine acetyltransferase/N-acetylglutamate synthase [Clostridiales bacterium]
MPVSPEGFLSSGVHSGIKKQKKDISLILSTVPAEAAGCFTRNKVKAAPVVWCQEVCSAGGKVRAIVTNSGNANACTGQAGYENAKKTAGLAASLIGCDPSEVLVCSTGVIGVPLPMDKIENGVKQAFSILSDSEEMFLSALEGIMTTDTTLKIATSETQIGGKNVKLRGMAKGSGMIHPNMGTLLAYVATDCSISKSLLQEALTESVDETFNMVSVDGDTSTNDTCLVLANGLAGNAVIEERGPDYENFKNSLFNVLKSLAIEIARDGEGAGRLIEVKAVGARSIEDAKKLAKSVVSSTLFKAAIFGADANWGRALCAMGYSGAEFDPAKASIAFESDGGSIKPFQDGDPVAFDEGIAKKALTEKEIRILISLNDGEFEATAWGCDLTYEYIRINGDYRS